VRRNIAGLCASGKAIGTTESRQDTVTGIETSPARLPDNMDRRPRGNSLNGLGGNDTSATADGGDTFDGGTGANARIYTASPTG